jgi:putative spermidine/putrescine transport system ATP-binding protein
MNETPSVRIENATFTYPGSKTGVFDITLDIAPGELLICIGPSGCGKTTLLKLIAGFLPCAAGRILLGGEDITAVSVRLRQCGVVFQSYALFPHMSVLENVAYPLRVRGISLSERNRLAEAMLEMVGLGGFGKRLPAELSGGQQQRVALGRALVFRPRVLLLDEPLSALDAATRMTMRDEIRRIQKKQNIAALLITHDQNEALSMADRIAIMRDGRLVQLAPPQSVYDRPADGYVAGFIGRANLLDGRTISSDAVETPIGRIRTEAHSIPPGTPVRLLVRPEKIEPAVSMMGENHFAAMVVHDRFFGASREIELSVGKGMLKIDTITRDGFAYIHIPRHAVQFLPTH